jgi:hypothetical protein
MDILCDYHNFDVQWGNHDILWMGAASGNLVSIANVIRMCLRFGNMATLEDGYGINLLPLATFAMEAYGDDPCALFMPKTKFADNAMDEKTTRLIAQMHKAITIIQFKLEGEIIRRDGEVGDYFSVNQPVFYLRKANVPLRLVVDVDEEDIPAVQPGQPVLITTDAFSGQVFHATVSDITPKGDAVTRSYRVRVILPASLPFLIGMTAEANIITAQRDNALLLPNSALINNSVWLFKADKAVQQPVKIGAKSADKTEITEGLSEQDLLIVDPPLSLKPNQPVNATLQETAGAQS